MLQRVYYLRTLRHLPIAPRSLSSQRAATRGDHAPEQIGGVFNFGERSQPLQPDSRRKPNPQGSARLRTPPAGAALFPTFFQKNPEAAAKLYESVSIAFDDDQISPQAMEKAYSAYRTAGKTKESQAILNKLQSRYPEYAQDRKLR